jgi:hypothetical protein
MLSVDLDTALNTNLVLYAKKVNNNVYCLIEKNYFK